MGTQWDETGQWWFDQEQKRWRPVAEWQGEPPPAPPAPPPPSGQSSEDRQHWFDQEQKRWRPAAEWQGAPPPPPTPRKRGQRWPWVVGGAVALVVLMGVCLAAVNSSSSSLQSTATVSSPTAAAKATAQPTATPTPAPTPTPVPVATAVSTPAQPPPAPARNLCGAPPNPWGYNFCGGNLIYSPPSNFCSYFSCIPSFWQSTNGYVDQCSDGKYSHSGGRQGACSYHGGEMRPLYGP